MTTFTSESVCAGHPDKICDQISDAILDAVLAQDPNGRVAVETIAKEKLILAGELTTSAIIDPAAIARQQLRRLGYTNPIFGFTDQCEIELLLTQQSPEIAQGVDAEGAGDQGMMFGYACRETDQLMPLPIALAHVLARQLDAARERGDISYLRPDGKTQVTVRYEAGQPVGVEHIVLAVPHQEEIALDHLRHDLLQEVVVPVLASFALDLPEHFTVNGTGAWYVGGPQSDAGLTGRKVVVDTYGGYARVGGGAFSGKDPSKVDRSGAYAARYLARSIVSHGLADRAEVRLAYVIGQPRPLMQEVETFGTATVSDDAIRDFMNQLLDTSVLGIIDGLQLRRPIYTPTAAYGHFGRDQFPWEADA